MRKIVKANTKQNPSSPRPVKASSYIAEDMKQLSERLSPQDRGKLDPIPAYIYNMGDGKTCIAFDDPNGGPSMIVGDFEAEEFDIYSIAESWGIESTQM